MEMRFSREELLADPLKKKKRKTGHAEITSRARPSWGKEELSSTAPKVPAEIYPAGPSLGMVGDAS